MIRLLEERGYYCFHEVIRDLTLEAKRNGNRATFESNPLTFVEDPLKFNEFLINSRLEHFKAGEDLSHNVIFYDRGMPDVLAYMKYFDQEYPDEFVSYCMGNKYDGVIILPPWEEIYTQDEERLESFEQAMEIHEELIRMYEEFRYETLVVPRGTVEERTAYIIKRVIPAN